MNKPARKPSLLPRKPLTNKDLVRMVRFALEDERAWSPATRERGRRAFEILALNIDDSDSVPDALFRSVRSTVSHTRSGVA